VVVGLVESNQERVLATLEGSHGGGGKLQGEQRSTYGTGNPVAIANAAWDCNKSIGGWRGKVRHATILLK